jgi:penicillin-binding protein 2
MATTDTNLADRSGNLVESHKGYDSRIIFFHFVLAALLLILMAGLAYQQLRRVGEYADAERQQNQRRVLFPGPRGYIYDRTGKLIVGNEHQFAVLLHLDELKSELQREFYRIRNNYRAAGDKDIPDYSQLQQIARVTLVQRYLDQVNAIIGRHEQVNARELRSHFSRQLLLPYTLLGNLSPPEYARLIERLPVRSPLEVFATNIRSYPYGSAAAHTLGYVRPDTEVEAESFPGDDLTTFKMKGSSGRDGLEKWFDSTLQGEAGGRIYRVDPAGYKINPPLHSRTPKQGRHLTTSIDIELQQAAEESIGDQTGAAVAIEIATGEVLVLATKPGYDLAKFSPRASHEVVADMTARGAWVNHALNGFYPPGSTFKILTTIAGLRHGTITPDDPIVFCDGRILVGNRLYPCDVGNGHHGHVLLRDAIAQSCDIYYYRAGEMMTPEVLAAEARRFRLDQRTGIELPNEQGRMLIPDPDWKLRARGVRWMPGDTANMAIGQGDVLVTPLQMACFVASVARGEVHTQPTLLHRPGQRQHSEPIGLSPAQRAALIEGMAGTISHPKGTGRTLETAALKIPGIRLAGKTGTAQLRVVQEGRLGTINLAWFICFAPVEKPEIAMAVMVVGDTIGEDFYGGRNAGPIVSAVLKRYFEQRSDPAPRLVVPFRTE